jgi:glycolate oxidase iron-sulfur subunit
MMIEKDPELGSDMRSRVEMLAKKTMDINQFLVSKLGVGTEEVASAKDAVGVTYHDPCHLKKSLGVSEEPRKLIRTNSGYRLAEMAEADWCCGLGGSFNLQYYEISSDIGQRKRENIVQTEASIVAAGCPACMIQLSDVLSKSGDQVAVRHPVEIYADSLPRD